MAQSTLPKGTTFLFKELEISPRGGRQNPHEHPPSRWDHFEPVYGKPAEVWRWTDGVIISEVNTLGLSSHYKDDNLHSCTTMFLQPQLGKLLVLPYDVRTMKHEDRLGRWVEVAFLWPQQRGNRFYTEVRDAGEQDTFVRNASSSWRRLFHPSHNPGPEVNPQRVNAGLTGQLSLILALVTFSCLPPNLPDVLMNYVKLGKWEHHSYDDGWAADRGIVLAVWQDPRSSTDKEMLKDMEDGKFGPIFEP